MLLSGISTWVRQDFSPHPPILGLQLQQGLVEVPGTRVHAETGPLNRPLEERLTHFEIQMSPDPLQPAPAPGWVVIVLLKSIFCFSLYLNQVGKEAGRLGIFSRGRVLTGQRKAMEWLGSRRFGSGGFGCQRAEALESWEAHFRPGDSLLSPPCFQLGSSQALAIAFEKLPSG